MDANAGSVVAGTYSAGAAASCGPIPVNRVVVPKSSNEWILFDDGLLAAPEHHALATWSEDDGKFVTVSVAAFDLVGTVDSTIWNVGAVVLIQGDHSQLTGDTSAKNSSTGAACALLWDLLPTGR